MSHSIEEKMTFRQEGLFLYLSLLTFSFILIQINFFILGHEGYFLTYHFIAQHVAIPSSTIWTMLLYFAAQLFLHFIFCVLIWFVTILLARFFYLNQHQTVYLGVCCWFFYVGWAIVANHYFYPLSKWADLSKVILFNRSVTRIIFVLFSLIGTLSIFLSFWESVKSLCQNKWCKQFVFTFVLLFFSVLLFAKINYSSAKPNSSISRPNIILIGIDSLRPGFLSYFGSDELTPFFDSILQQSTVFGQAVTPSARTFPSWTSLLTGLYPRENGIRFNLAKQTHHSSDTLPAILQRDGYRTIYATDEVRFSNIEKASGFNEVITPPMGVNDFLLPLFNDFPLSNLVANTYIGKILFPHSYANRAAYFVYRPNTFLHLVEPSLKPAEDRPLFLAIHFCLPHTPYMWSQLDRANQMTPIERYEASVLGVDEQIKNFFALLKENHLLDHAIVVLLSDHGEALELPGDRITDETLFLGRKNQSGKIPHFYPTSLDGEAVNASVGHGTDVLGLPQYHTLLAFKFYGVGKQVMKVIPQTVSLLDIKPTILALLHAKAQRASGQSLLDFIQGRESTLRDRHFFIESDLSSASIRTVYPNMQEVMIENINYFRIDPKTSRLIVKEDMAQMIIKTKQYADIYGHWMLALYPESSKHRIPILVNLISGEWTNDMDSLFAKKSPVLQMRSALNAFYGEEIN